MGSLDTVTVAWHTATVKILMDLTSLVDQMVPLMEQIKQVQDRSLCLRYASIISLMTIAEIHNVLSNTTPDSIIKRLESLQTLAQLTEEIPWELRHLMDQYICVSSVLESTLDHRRLIIMMQICWDKAVAPVNSLPASELGALSPYTSMAVMSHAKTTYDSHPSDVSTDPSSICANSRAVDERLWMACEAQ